MPPPPLLFPLWSGITVFSQAEVRAAFAALHASGNLPWPDDASRSTSASTTPHPLLRFSSHRTRTHPSGEPSPTTTTTATSRDHFEIPLHLVLRDPSPHTRSGAAASVRSCLPDAVQHVLDGLYDANMTFVAAQLNHTCISDDVRRDVWTDLPKKSVLRLLRYQSGSGCRPHVDPGLSTALLAGSAGGLEVFDETQTTSDGKRESPHHRSVVASADDGNGDYSGCDAFLPGAASPTCAGADACGTWRSATSLLTSSPSADAETVSTAAAAPALVMRGRMLQVLSRGALPGVLHRAAPDWAATRPGNDGDRSHCADVRYNIVVELRPAKPKQLYALCSA